MSYSHALRYSKGNTHTHDRHFVYMWPCGLAYDSPHVVLTVLHIVSFLYQLESKGDLMYAMNVTYDWLVSIFSKSKDKFPQMKKEVKQKESLFYFPPKDKPELLQYRFLLTYLTYNDRNKPIITLTTQLL